MSGTNEIGIGVGAPSVVLPCGVDEICDLAKMHGQNVVLYFYPKDSTPGCTTEAIDFTGLMGEFKAANTVVWGVSKDSLKRHDNFKGKHNLSVTLLSDAEGDVCERYGVWVEKKMYGKTFWGIERATFLIGSDGKIAQIWRKVKVAGHAAEVLEAAKALT